MYDDDEGLGGIEGFGRHVDQMVEQEEEKKKKKKRKRKKKKKTQEQ